MTSVAHLVICSSLYVIPGWCLPQCWVGHTSLAHCGIVYWSCGVFKSGCILVTCVVRWKSLPVSYRLLSGAIGRVPAGRGEGASGQAAAGVGASGAVPEQGEEQHGGPARSRVQGARGEGLTASDSPSAEGRCSAPIGSRLWRLPSM